MPTQRAAPSTHGLIFVLLLLELPLPLQSRGLKLNPITTLYLIAPCCFAFLCVPFVSEP